VIFVISRRSVRFSMRTTRPAASVTVVSRPAASYPSVTPCPRALRTESSLPAVS
jgi:hypothetical protein